MPIAKEKQRNISDLPQDYVDVIVDMMRDEGCSIKEVLSELKITASVHARFCKIEPKYKQAFQDGKDFAEAWWMTKGRMNILNKGLNVGIYAFQMKNRFKWRDNPLLVGGAETNKLDNYKEKEIVEKYKKSEVSNEKVKESLN